MTASAIAFNFFIVFTFVFFVVIDPAERIARGAAMCLEKKGVKDSADADPLSAATWSPLIEM